ncbi:enoyl-CoA hydratase [Thermodesulfobacteriota bacterium]
MTEFETILYETPAEGVARIVQNRPKVRNAQNLQMTYDINAAFDRACQDDSIRVIILAGSDPHFSSGHDMKAMGEQKPQKDFPVVGTWAGFENEAAHGRFPLEREIFLDMVRRWRNVPKPTIAQVQGKCIAGGLMLAWACDIIVASDDAMFCDPVVAMGVCGVEYFAHPWELGPRKAKELLFTAEWWSAQEAYRLGMVNHVVQREVLAEFTLDMAGKIARKPMFALKLTKEAVNNAVDVMGQRTAMDLAFSLHQLCHSHNDQVHGVPVDPSGIPQAVKKEVKTEK